RSSHWFERLGFLILAILVAPVAEEVFFRGMVYNALRRRLHIVVAIPLQAIVFGLMHPFGLLDTTFIATIGVVLGSLYEGRRTLLSPMLAHAFIGAFGIAVITWMSAADAAAPRLGVHGEAHESGCKITAVVPGGGAEAAGLRVGDV